MGRTGICGHGLSQTQMNMNKEMMMLSACVLLCVLMCGPDTGPLLLLPPHTELIHNLAVSHPLQSSHVNCYQRQRAQARHHRHYT